MCVCVCACACVCVCVCVCRGGVVVRALDSQPKGWWFESHRDYWRLNIRSIVVNYHLMFPVHTSPPSCNGYLAFAGVQIQLNALTYQLQEFASTGSECLLRAQGKYAA